MWGLGKIKDGRVCNECKKQKNHLNYDPDNREYLSLLNLDENGVMGSIKIPKIFVELPIFHGTDATTRRPKMGYIGMKSRDPES